MSLIAHDGARYLVGTSGWHYDDWRGRFYPADVPKARWLAFYARSFSTVELNASFYRLPSEGALRSWYEQTPPGFLFAVKASRLITHYRRLLDVAEALEVFYARARRLGEKLGPILYQLPPDLERDDERLESFLAALPADLRHAVEFRHPSWFVEPIFAALSRRGVAFCVFSMVGLACPLVATASFAYFRFHGSAGRYGGSYGEESLAAWSTKITGLTPAGGKAYCYFNNDARAQAVGDALTLRAKLHAAPPA